MKFDLRCCVCVYFLTLYTLLIIIIITVIIWSDLLLYIVVHAPRKRLLYQLFRSLPKPWSINGFIVFVNEYNFYNLNLYLMVKCISRLKTVYPNHKLNYKYWNYIIYHTRKSEHHAQIVLVHICRASERTGNPGLCLGPHFSRGVIFKISRSKKGLQKMIFFFKGGKIRFRIVHQFCLSRTSQLNIFSMNFKWLLNHYSSLLLFKYIFPLRIYTTSLMRVELNSTFIKTFCWRIK